MLCRYENEASGRRSGSEWEREMSNEREREMEREK